ncbi:MAG: hypothetical protein JHD02_05230 [Thermoleophilaceae bacterium]|nr:hypothetical protein [Thermoleophilaceae bacterium]
MQGRRRASRTAALVALATSAVIFAAVFSGCSWLGKGMEVSDAYKKANEAKSGAFYTEFSASAPKTRRQEVLEEFYSMTGAWDNTDPAHPKSRMEVTVDGETFKYIEPGNGRVYFSYDGETDYVKLGAKDRPRTKNTSNKFINAIARAVVNFRDAPAVTNGVGQPIPAIAADVSRVKLCGISLRQAVRSINNSSLVRNEVGVRITRRETREAANLCVKSFPTSPQLTFGIDNGLLTDYRLQGTVRDGKRIVDVNWKLQLTGLNQPQTGFIPPKASSKGKRRELRASVRAAGHDIDNLIESIPAP